MSSQDSGRRARPRRRWGPVPDGALVIRPRRSPFSTAAPHAPLRSSLYRVASLAGSVVLIALGVWGLLAGKIGVVALLLGTSFIAGVIVIWFVQPGTLLYEFGGYLGQRLIHGTRYEIPTAAVADIRIGSLQIGETTVPCILFEGSEGTVLMRHLNARYEPSDLEELARRAGVDFVD